MEWAGAWAVQAGIRGHLQNCSVQQVLFRGGWQWKGKCVLRGNLKAPKKTALGAVQRPSGGGVDIATNRGVRMNGGVISTYEQKCWGWARAVTNGRCLKTGSTWSGLTITSWKRHGRRSCGRCYDTGGSLVSAGTTKFFTNKATLGPIMQIIQNHFIGFGNVFFRCDSLSRTRSDLSGSFPSAFRLAELVEIVHNHRWGEPFFAQFNGSVLGSRRLGINGLFLNLFSRLLASQPSNLTIQSRSETAAGSRTTHLQVLWPSESDISTAY